MYRRLFFYVFAGLFVCLPIWSQKPEFDFYPEFRNEVMPKHYLANPRTTLTEIVADYSADLKAGGVVIGEKFRQASVSYSAP
jgi:hypothetical protein